MDGVAGVVQQFNHLVASRGAPSAATVRIEHIHQAGTQADAAQQSRTLPDIVFDGGEKSSSPGFLTRIAVPVPPATLGWWRGSWFPGSKNYLSGGKGSLRREIWAKYNFHSIPQPELKSLSKN
jgi:hypothetical protein